MKTFKIAAVALFSVVCIQIPVSAACGGGGWHKAKSVTVASAAPAPVVEAQYETRAQPSDRYSTKTYFDTARFDAVSSQLQLSDDQSSNISKAEDDVRSRLDGLYGAKAKAESRYARCTGNCDKERRDLEQANSAYYNFFPNKEFDRRLSSILNEQQMSMYQRNTSR